MVQKNNSGPASGNRWLWLPAVTVLLLLVLLLSIPYGISWVVKDWLLENGAGKVEISDVDFNPFTGMTSIELLNVRVDDRNTLVIPHLTLALDWMPFLDRRVYVRKVVVDGVSILIEEDDAGELTVGGIGIGIGDDDTGEIADEPWDYGIVELEILNSTIDYRSPDLQLKAEISNLVLGELATWLTESASLEASGVLNGGGFALDGELPSLESGYGYSGHVRLDGFPLETIAVLAEPSVKRLAGKAVLDTKLILELTPENQFSLQQSGALQVDSLHLALPAEQYELDQGSARWDGAISWAGDASPDITVSGKLQLVDTDLDIMESNIQLAGFERLDANDIEVQGSNAVSVGSLSISNAVFAETLGEFDQPGIQAGEPPPLQIASLEFGNITITDARRLSIDTILSDQATYVAQRSKGGEWRMATIFGSLPPPPPESEDAPPSDVPASIRVGELKNINGTQVIEDYTVTPPFKVRLKFMEVTKNLDSAQPDQDTHVYLKGNIAKHNSIEIQGVIRPFAEPFAMNLESSITGLELPPFSTYAVDAIGYRLDSGELEAVSTVKVVDGKFDGQNDLTMRSLQISPVEGESLDKMHKQLSVPLDRALDMLRDQHDVIRMQLPITGDIDSPEFDASDAINQAVATATKEGAITTLTLLLQPYGSVITVARYAADKAAEVQLDPVIFSPASAEIDPERHDYLGKVADIVKQRPNINVRLCGVATGADRTALQGQGDVADKDRKQQAREPAASAIDDQQLLQLADRREEAIKDFFIDQHGVKSGRLVACQPKIDTKEGAEPRVDLLI